MWGITMLFFVSNEEDWSQRTEGAFLSAWTENVPGTHSHDTSYTLGFQDNTL